MEKSIDITKLIFLALQRSGEMSESDLFLHIPEIGRKKSSTKARQDLHGFCGILQAKKWITIAGSGRNKRFVFVKNSEFTPGTTAAYVNKNGSFPVHYGPIFPYKDAINVAVAMMEILGFGKEQKVA